MKKIPALIFAVLLFAQFTACQQKTKSSGNIPAEYLDLPNLMSPINDSLYTIEKVGEKYSDIFYDTTYNFYLINGGGKLVKLNENGHIVFESDKVGMLDYSHYALDSNGVYDLSKNKPQLEKFQQVINLNNELNEDEWKKKFFELYASSEIVIFGFSNVNYYGCSPMYFRKNNKWLLLYENGRVIYNRGYVIKCSIDGKEIAEKYTKMHL